MIMSKMSVLLLLLLSVTIYPGSVGSTVKGAMSIVDPCRALCDLLLKDCEFVEEYEGNCLNIYKDASNSFFLSTVNSAAFKRVSRDEAMDYIAVGPQECSGLCQATPNCHVSYCKPNNHCKGLFWENFEKHVPCYFSLTTPCNANQPILCKFSVGYTSESVATSPVAIQAASKSNAVESTGTKYPETKTVAKDVISSKPSEQDSTSQKPSEPDAGTTKKLIEKSAGDAIAVDNNQLNTANVTTTKSAMFRSNKFIILISMVIFVVFH